MKKFIILDRDGVVNYDSSAYVKSPDEWQPIPGSLEAIATLNRAGFSVFIATNQSGIGRGFYDVHTLHLIHEKMRLLLNATGGHIEEFFFCPHLPTDNCLCRKPKPGMLHAIQKKYAIDLTKVFFIGDKASDVEAAMAASCKPLLVQTFLEKIDTKTHPDVLNVPCFLNLSNAVDYVIEHS